MIVIVPENTSLFLWNTYIWLVFSFYAIGGINKNRQNMSFNSVAQPAISGHTSLVCWYLSMFQRRANYVLKGVTIKGRICSQ